MDPLLRTAEDAGELAPPHSWHVTTDSLAAWAATRLNARLLLAKSADVPSGSVEDAVATGLVDRWFGRAIAPGVDVDWVNLRTDVPRVMSWVRRETESASSAPTER
jgi:hypothetical protein